MMKEFIKKLLKRLLSPNQYEAPGKLFYTINGKLKTLLGITKTFIQHPILSFRQLGQLPATVRGCVYAQKWQHCATKTASPSLPNPQQSSVSANPLRLYFDSHKEGKGVWKWLHYFDIYHRYFQKFVGREVHILEIGIYSGGSLEMWKSYFGSKCHVYGIDIKEACKVYENEYTEIFIGDQADRTFWKQFKEKAPKIDIMIDDGGHQAEQQIVTLEEMLPHLSPGGIYLCEDIHGIRNEFAAYLYALSDNLNATHVSPTQFQGWIKSIHFYPYVTVIEKAEKPEEIFIAPKHGTQWQPFYEK